MVLRLLITPILAALLLSTVGCTKKDDPATGPTAGMGSYKLDGVLKTCQVTMTSTALPNSSVPIDLLTIDLATTAETAVSGEHISLYYQKPAGQPIAAYEFQYILHFLSKPASVGSLYDNGATTLTPTSSGGFSGTFSGREGTTTSTITEGNFITK